MRDYLILRVVAKFIIPFILLFGLYTQLHGDYGPGGGFQAGVIFASAFILYGLVFGLPTAKRVLPVSILLLLVPLGMLIFIATGLAGFLGGGNFLEYGVFASDPADGNHIGILIVEVGIGITVAAVVALIFFAFAGRR